MNMQQLSSLILPFIFIIIFYFLLIRPQQKRDKAIKGLSYLTGAVDFRTDIGSKELIQSKIDLINSFNFNV